MAPAYGAAVNEGRKQAKKVFSHLEVHHAENGGHIVKHHFTSYEHEPEMHVFAHGEGHKMLAHIGQHMGVTNAETTHDIDKAEGTDKGEIDA